MEDRYTLLLQCYLSGQMSEKQWQEHLRDPELEKWYKDYLEEKRKILDEKFNSLLSG